MEKIFSTKAMENIRAAEILFDQEMYNASANRSYYAALHAAIAVLAKAGTLFEKIDHGKIQAKFSSELIHRRKIYSSRFKSYLMKLQAVRNTADYETRLLSKKVAKRQLDRAKEYTETLQKEMTDVQ